MCGSVGGGVLFFRKTIGWDGGKVGEGLGGAGGAAGGLLRLGNRVAEALAGMVRW